jgi:hypothetical protein
LSLTASDCQECAATVRPIPMASFTPATAQYSHPQLRCLGCSRQQDLQGRLTVPHGSRLPPRQSGPAPPVPHPCARVPAGACDCCKRQQASITPMTPRRGCRASISWMAPDDKVELRPQHQPTTATTTHGVRGKERQLHSILIVAADSNAQHKHQGSR